MICGAAKLQRRLIHLFAVSALLLAPSTNAYADEDTLKEFSKDLNRHLIELDKIDKKDKRDEKKDALDKTDPSGVPGLDDNRDPGAANTRDDLRKKWLENFMDTDFGRKDFDDLSALGDSKRILIGKRSWLKDAGKDKKDDPDGKEKDHYLDDLVAEYKKDRKKDDLFEYKKIRKEIRDALHDWVPADPDPGDNGGFALGADNGSPVPYKLNGWITIERGLPWEAN